MDWRSCGRNRRPIPIPRYRTPIGCTEVIAELSAADHSASSVARQRIRRRKKRRRTQIPPPDAVRAIADLATQIESGPARRHVHACGTLHVGNIGCCSKFNRHNAYARNDGERSTDAEKHMASPWSPPTRNFRKLAGNVGESAASLRLLPDKVNKFCGFSLGRRTYGK